MLIDVHAHIGTSGPGAVPPGRVVSYAGTCGIDVVLVSNRDAAGEPQEAANLNETDANVACLAACRAHARLKPLYWVRPGQVDSNVNAFAGALGTEPFVGAVFSPAENGFDGADPLLDPYLAVLARAGRPALFCVRDDGRATPARVYEQACRHPRVPIVLCLCGVAKSQRAAGLDVICHAQRQQNADLYLDTSHATADEVRAAVRAAGAERVLFGSDALSHGDAHIPLHITLLDELRKSLTPDEFRQVAGANAVRLFGLRPARG